MNLRQLAFAFHVLWGMTEHRCTSRSAWRRSKRRRIGMGLPTVDFRLRAGKADVLPVLRQLDAHLLADLFEDLRDPLDLGGIGIANREHRVYMPLLGADRHRAAVRSCPDH